jgi:hypothetical protein
VRTLSDAQSFEEPMRFRESCADQTKQLLRKLSWRTPLIVIPLVTAGAVVTDYLLGELSWNNTIGQILYLQLICSPFYLFFLLLYLYFRFLHRIPEEQIEIGDDGLFAVRGSGRIPVFKYKHVRGLRLTPSHDYYIAEFGIRRPLSARVVRRMAVPTEVWEKRLKHRFECPTTSVGGS